VWGINGRVDTLEYFFIHNFEEENLSSAEPVKITPAWRNNKLGKERISKRLDKFIFYDGISLTNLYPNIKR
jgi:hypothetical protein